MARGKDDYEAAPLALITAPSNVNAIPIPTAGQPTNGIGARKVVVNNATITFAGTQAVDHSKAL